MGKGNVVEGEGVFYKLLGQSKYMDSGEPRLIQVDVELTNRCPGSCVYCFADSGPSGEISLPEERVFRLIDEISEMGIRSIVWTGGEPSLYPRIFDIVSYAAGKGMRNSILLSGLTVSEEITDWLRSETSIRMIGVHLDSINPEVYDKVHTRKGELGRKIEGYRKLREACADRIIFGFITISKPIIETVEETIDWFVDEMGAEYINMLPFKPTGFGKENSYLEPTLSEVKKAFEHRAKRLGEELIRIGPSECSQFFCKSFIYITCEGDVLPCALMPHHSAGNILSDKLPDIVERERDMVHWHNVEIKGQCGDCENNDVCFGCRANAYYYSGDMYGSDPKCWMNPEAKETYF